MRISGYSFSLFILTVLTPFFFLTFPSNAEAAIRTDTGLSGNTLAANDDGSTAAVNLGFTANYIGTNRTQVIVNNNGNITFGSSLSTFTPAALSGGSANRDIIAPFWADVDTDPFGDAVTYGTATIAGRAAFAANYVNVDYYNSNSNHGTQLNDFQVVLFSRSDVSAGDFDIEFNYDDINWETGDASSGSAGLGGTSARAGFANAAGTTSHEIAGAGVAGGYLDTNTSTGLANTSNIAVTGRRYFLARNGSVIVPGRDDLALVASTDSQKPVAAALDTHLIASTGDMGRVMGQIYTLPTSNLKRAALNQLHPVVNGDVALTSFTALNQHTKIIAARLDNIRSGPLANQTGLSSGEAFKNTDVWAKGFANYSEQNSHGGISGYEAKVIGSLVGLDRPYRNHTSRLGASLGIAGSDVDSNDQLSGTEVASYQGGLYHSCDRGRTYFDTVLSFAWNEYEAQRKIDIGNIHRLADADYDGQQYSLYVGGGHPIKDGRNIITPFASLQYTYLYLEDYAETGAGDLNLTVGDEHYNTLRSGLGLKLARPITNAKGTFIPAIRASWLHEFLGEKIESTATFTGGGGSFETKGIKPKQDALNLGLELTWLTKGNLIFLLNYDYERRTDFFAHSGAVTVRISL